MTVTDPGRWFARPAAAAALRYGLAFASIAAAMGLARLFLYFHLPQPFAAFALSAIAITFWYGGNMPGIVAALLASIIRYSHWSEAHAVSRAIYDLVFLIFAFLMMAINRSRSELEVRVAERTADLTRANEELSLKIAEHKRTEEKLRESEAYLAEAQTLSGTGSWARVSATGEMRYWSEECFRVLGFDPQDGPPRFETFLQRVHPDDRAKVREISAAAGRDKIDYETDYRIIHPGGEIRDIHVVAHPVFNPSGDLVEFVGTVMDVTERKHAEDKLRQSEAYLAEAQKLTHTGSWVWEVAPRRALHLSEEWYRIYGFDPEEGMITWEKRLERIHPDDRAGQQQAIYRAINEKSDYEVEYRIILPSGTIRHLHSVGHPVLDASGNLVQFVGSSTDITERRQAEEALRQAQADLARISRITTMGELTASLAHEVNQPIAAAVTDANTCLRWLNRDQPDLDEAREAASRMVKDATRAAEIISRTRLLFKKVNPQWESLDMHEIIREMVALMSGEAARYSISVWAELAAELPEVMGDRVQLQQVLMNLLVNSIEAMKDADGPRELIIRSQTTENGQLMVSISDTGVGLPPQQANKIFDAFFTTKPQGTGMGLRISRSIVESHGGRLWAADNSSRGASFHLSLPTKVETHE
jgi:PAS domain S-box-containing protein